MGGVNLSMKRRDAAPMDAAQECNEKSMGTGKIAHVEVKESDALCFGECNTTHRKSTRMRCDAHGSSEIFAETLMI